MTETKREIIDELLKTFKYDVHFENEHFLYWVQEEYYYNGDFFTRDEFEEIQNYVVKNGTVPSEKIIREKENSVSWELKGNSHKTCEYGASKQTILRYSKKYDSIEFYNYNKSIKSPYNMSSKRILIISKKIKIFSVNSKNYVLINGNRWLSLKNWSGFCNNNIFKEDFVKLLLSKMLGEKEWVINLEKERSIYISNKNSRKANSFDEAIGLECGGKPVKSIKKLLPDENDIINFYQLVEPNKVHAITNLIKNHEKQLKHLLTHSHNGRAIELITLCFLCKDNRCDKQIVRDYLQMLIKEGDKINLNISSYKTLKARHDDLSEKILKKSNKKNSRLRVSKDYPKIIYISGVDIELIKTTKRLDHESEILHHCVHGYSSRVNSGECAIYSMVHNGQRYTLQLGKKSIPTLAEGDKKEKDYKLKLSQLKGKYNCNAPPSIKKSLELICKAYDILPLEESSIKLRGEEYEAKEYRLEAGVASFNNLTGEVKQIGEKILYEIS